MNRAAVIINEFGEVGIDHELVANSSESMTLLSNGCLCCAVRTDLQETMRELFIKRRAGEVIDFDRVFIETTGLADPVPVLHTLQTDGMLGAQYRLDCVVTLVDAVNGERNLDDTPEAAKQAAVADRIVITKSDIAPPSAVASLEARLARMNPYAARAIAVNGEVDVAFLRDVGPEEHPRARRTSNAGSRPRVTPRPEGAYLGERVRAGQHDASIRSFCLWFDKPFTWDSFAAAVQVLTSLRGQRSAARQGSGQCRRRSRTGAGAGRAARVPSAGHARSLGERGPSFAPRVHHPEPRARIGRVAFCRRRNRRRDGRGSAARCRAQVASAAVDGARRLRDQSREL